KTIFCIKCGKSLDTESPVIDENQNCPLCRQEIPTGHSFCHLCGARLQSSVQKGSQAVICNHCWKPNPPNTGYCVHCGSTDFGRKTKRSLILEKPFEGFQVELSQLLIPASIPLTIIRQGTSRSFPIKSTISHSSSFGVVHRNHQTLSSLNKNFGGFNRQNLLNYIGSFILVTMIYFYWYFRYSTSDFFLNIETDPILDGLFGIMSGFLLTSLLMMPIWLATFFVYRKTGYQVNYRLDTSRVLITAVFNFLWIYFGGGPIILRLGDIKTTEERGIRNQSFVKGISWGSIYTVCITFLLAILSIGVVGLVGEFSGFLFQDFSLKTHSIAVFFGATWISLILILPLGDFYDRVLKQWNIVVYFIMLIVILLTFYYSIQVLSIVAQETYRP
ncbi:MAG: zinc ribbon domain-containing protein, partial [Candidatus Heimdallarchaeota archaeon]|nr:zinc ribbon domain-containing protein [Candidatus Heimdallarchaeota archaeon]